MNNNIDFSDFHKISVDRPSKCRKFTKHKFTLFSIFIIIILVIVIIVFVNKKNQQNKKEEEFAELKNEINLLDINLTKILNQVNETKTKYNTLESNYNETIDNIKSNKTELSALNTTNEELKANFNELKEEFNNLKSKLSYIEEIKAKIELKDLITERLTNLGIEYSNVVKDVAFFESISFTKVKKKCYDSMVYDFNPEKFEQNCRESPLLFLIKTEKGKNIGVYTSKNIQEKVITEDPDSLLINFDDSKIYNYNSQSSDECSFYFNNENFLKFGKDLIINNDGSGNSEFPNCYESEDEKNAFVENEFKVEILEIYKVEKN